MDLWVSVLAALAAAAVVTTVAVAASSAALHAGAEAFKAEEYNSSEVVANLRRQLMRDNYDYMVEASTERPYRYHAESDDGEPPAEVVRASTASMVSTLETPVDFYTKVTSADVTQASADLRDLRRNPMYDQRSKYVAPSERKKLATAGADKVLYADDDKARRQNDRFTLTDPAAAEEPTPREVGDYRRRDATVKYSLVKMGPARRSGRRGGLRAGRRAHLVKEEKPGEVSIVNLGEGAVPQFRLPRPRAQYMRDSEAESEREAAPSPRAPRTRREPLPAVDLD